MNYSGLHRSRRLNLLHCLLAELFFWNIKIYKQEKKISSLYPWVVFKSANFQSKQHGKNAGGEADMFSRMQKKGKDTQGGGEILNWEIWNVGCAVAQFQEFVISVNIPLNLRSDVSCWNSVLRFPVCCCVGGHGHSYLWELYFVFQTFLWSENWQLTLS